jgi:uncharacterized protein (DUF2147 family)
MKPVLRPRRFAVLAAVFILLAVPCAVARAAVPEGVWLMDAKVAVQIFACKGGMCGRILWLKIPRDPQGVLDRDKDNPDPALRQRGLCGLTILWNLQPDGPNRWKEGWFYDPDDGKTYRVTAELQSPDGITARVYTLVRVLGQTKILSRVPHGTSDGWC